MDLVTFLRGKLGAFGDHLKAGGRFHFTKSRPDGRIEEVHLVKNLVPSAGKAAIASRINGAGSEAAATYLAVGTGTTAAAVGDTALQSEVSTNGLARANATASRVTTTVTNDTAQLQYTWTASGSVAVTEAGIFNAASVGTLFARQVFSAINVVANDTLQLTYKIACS